MIWRRRDRRVFNSHTDELFMVVLLTILAATAGAQRGARVTALDTPVPVVDHYESDRWSADAPQHLRLRIDADGTISMLLDGTEARVGPAEGVCPANLDEDITRAAARLHLADAAVTIEGHPAAPYCVLVHAERALSSLREDGVVRGVYKHALVVE